MEKSGTMNTDPMPHLVRHLVDMDYDRLPSSAVACAKTFLLDTLGVGIAGANGTGVAALRSLARSWGDVPEASIWGSGERLPAASAAFVNGYQIHSLEYDCVHERAVLHPMAPIVSSALAFAEQRAARGQTRINGRSLISAIVAGVDIATFLGFAARGPVRFFRPSTAGGFGAAAAIAKLAAFDSHRAANALGIQYSQTSGTMQAHVEGSPCLALQVGFAGRGGLVSAELAEAGFEGPKDVLVGRHGYFRLIENDKFDVESEIGRIGKEYQVEELAHKPFPSGRLTHGTIDALMQLQAKHGFKMADVAELQCFVPSLVARQVGRPDIPKPDPNYAKLCIPFVAATFLRHGQVDVGEFLGDGMLNDPVTHELAARVSVIEDDNPDPNAMNPQSFILTLKDGSRHELTIEHVLGHPEAPLTTEQNVNKFMRNWRTNTLLAGQDGMRLVDAIQRLETIDDVSDIVRLMVPE